MGKGDGTFQAPEQNATGNFPQAIAGDFNGDGYPDVVTANPDGTVSVLLGNGDGTFRAATEFGATSGSWPGSIIAGDFNGDGRLDLAVTSQSGDDVSIFLGLGDGTFAPPTYYAVGKSPLALVAGDFNGDGHLDLAVADSGSDDVSILLGNGDGTFKPAIRYPLEISPQNLVVGDFNGDGRLDLAVVGNANNAGIGEVSVLLGQGDGTFQAVAPFAVPYQTDALAAGDFNGDGHLDLAVAGQYDDQVRIFLGQGNGSFVLGGSFTARDPIYSLVAQDLNGDGKPDLVVNSYGGSSVWLGNGDGTFRPDGTLPGTAYVNSVAAADFNADGKVDLLVTSDVSNSVTVLLGNGDGTFAEAGQFATFPTASYTSPPAVDVNGDGIDDVLMVDAAGDILYRRGIPGRPGTFEPPVTINPGFRSRDIAWVPGTDQGPLLASVDVGHDSVSLFAYRDGGFVRVGSLATGHLPAQILAADLTGDGRDDLVVRDAGDGDLWVFFNGSPGPLWSRSSPFAPAVILAVGSIISDVRAVDTVGDGVLDLVITNSLTGQVSLLRNRGDGLFAAPLPYRAGTGLSEAVPGGSPEVTSLEATAGVAAGPLVPGGPVSLVTIDPGSNWIDVLAGLGGGRFANPVAIPTASPAQVVRMGDFNGDGVDDLAVLTADGLSIYLGNGKSGFLPPTTYAVPSEADGLTVADLLGNGKVDLLVGDAYGDVLVLMGNGDGTFQPYRQANQAVELAVADLTGKGSKDIIYADQGLDRVVVDYGAGHSAVLADQSTGLLEPGAVALADLNGDGIPDLIVADSGSNNVLIYPGLGHGQFGPAVNGGNGYFVGTNPVGITVATLTVNGLPDLVVADKGSNQVSILLNTSQPGGPISFTAGPRLNAGGTGPVSTVVGRFTAGPFPDLLVTNSGSNDVTLLPGVGQGFFNDQNPRIFSVGTDPVTSFVGNFNGQPDLVTVNAGSNDLTLIAGFEGSSPVVSTIASGGVDPTTAFDFSTGNGFEDLVVGNRGDGALALFEGGPEGLSLASVETEPNLPDPTALAFSALTGGTVQFYAATAGRESAALVALSLSIPVETVTALISSAPSSISVQLVALHETSLPLVATVLTLTIPVTGEESGAVPAESEALGVVATVAGSGISAGQGPVSSARGLGPTTDPTDGSNEPGPPATAMPSALTPWERFVLGLDAALEELDREGAGGVLSPSEPVDRPAPPPGPSVPAQGRESGARSVPERPACADPEDLDTALLPDRAGTIDAAIARLGTDRAASGPGEMGRSATGPGPEEPGLAAACLVVSLLAPGSDSRISPRDAKIRRDAVKQDRSLARSGAEDSGRLD
jgi:hypothetical protein